MKYFIALILFSACGQVVAQSKTTDTLKDEILTMRGTTFTVIPAYMRKSDTAFKFVSIWPDSTITIHGTDSLGAIKILLKHLREVQQEKEDLKASFRKSVKFSNSVPEVYKKNKAWYEYLSEIKKFGFTVIKK